MTTVALLTGRGNNSLKDKNILDILGKPVLYYPAIAGIRASHIQHWYVSSDDDKILEIAHQLKYQKIKRPAEISTPSSQHIDAIIHALKIMNNDNIFPNILVVILANNITIESKWIDDCVQLMKNDLSLSAVVPVYENNDHHPFRAKKVNIQGCLETFMSLNDSFVSTNRQDLPPCCFLCHNFWVLNVKKLVTPYNGQLPWSFMGDKVLPYFVEQSIDIHTEFDLRIASEWLEIKNRKL